MSKCRPAGYCTDRPPDGAGRNSAMVFESTALPTRRPRVNSRSWMSLGMPGPLSITLTLPGRAGRASDQGHLSDRPGGTCSALAWCGIAGNAERTFRRAAPYLPPVRKAGIVVAADIREPGNSGRQKPSHPFEDFVDIDGRPAALSGLGVSMLRMRS